MPLRKADPFEILHAAANGEGIEADDILHGAIGRRAVREGIRVFVRTVKRVYPDYSVADIAKMARRSPALVVEMLNDDGPDDEDDEPAPPTPAPKLREVAQQPPLAASGRRLSPASEVLARRNRGEFWNPERSAKLITLIEDGISPKSALDRLGLTYPTDVDFVEKEVDRLVKLGLLRPGPLGVPRSPMG